MSFVNKLWLSSNWLTPVTDLTSPSWLSPNWLVTDMVCHRFHWLPFQDITGSCSTVCMHTTFKHQLIPFQCRYMNKTTLRNSPAHTLMPDFSFSSTWRLAMSFERAMPCMSDMVKRMKSKRAAAAAAVPSTQSSSSLFVIGDVMTSPCTTIRVFRIVMLYS